MSQVGVVSWGCDSGACMGVIGCPLAPWQGYTSDFWCALYTVAMTRKGARAYNIQFFPKPTAHLLPSGQYKVGSGSKFSQINRILVIFKENPLGLSTDP